MFSKKTIEFSLKRDEENLAIFIARLEKEKVSYEIENLKYGWIVVIRGEK